MTSVCRPAGRGERVEVEHDFSLSGSLTACPPCIALLLAPRPEHGSDQENARDIKPLPKHAWPNRRAFDSACLQPSGNPIMPTLVVAFSVTISRPGGVNPCSRALAQSLRLISGATRALPKASINVHA